MKKSTFFAGIFLTFVILGAKLLVPSATITANESPKVVYLPVPAETPRLNLPSPSKLDLNVHSERKQFDEKTEDYAVAMIDTFLIHDTVFVPKPYPVYIKSTETIIKESRPRLGLNSLDVIAPLKVAKSDLPIDVNNN